jgi:hypothetical protein
MTCVSKTERLRISSTYFLTMNHTMGSCAGIVPNLSVHTLVDLSPSYVPEARTSVGFEYTYGQVNIHTQNIPAEKQITLHWSLARPPRRLCYSPVVVPCGLHVTTLSFSQGRIRRLFKKMLFHFLTFLKLRKREIGTSEGVCQYVHKAPCKICTYCMCTYACARVCVRSYETFGRLGGI